MHTLELSGEEPRRSVVAYEMMESGEFIAPQLYGLPYFNKPPAHNWLIVGASYLCGKNEFASRLPGVIAYLLTALLLYYVLKKEINESLAFLTTLLFLASADLLFYASIHAGEIDLVFMLVLFVSGYFQYRALRIDNRLSFWVLSYSFLALATLVKGFQAIPFAFFPLVLWLVLHKRIKTIWSLNHLIGAVSYVAVIAAYYWMLSSRADMEIWYANLFVESGSKVTSDGILDVLNQLTEAPLVILKLAAPWSLVLIALVSKKSREALSKQPIGYFAVIYLISHFWLYWFVIDVRDRYLYPFLPWLIIVSAMTIADRNWWPKKRNLILGIIVFMIIVRLGVNFIYMPLKKDGTISNRMKYRPLIEQLIAKTDGQEIGLYVNREQVDLPMTVYGRQKLDRQPIVPYQLPCYYHLRTGSLLQWTDELQADRHYLIFDSEKRQLPPHDRLMSFEEGWTKRMMTLIRVK